MGKEMNAAKHVDVGVLVENATYAQEDMDQESEPEENEAPVQTSGRLRPGSHGYFLYISEIC